MNSTITPTTLAGSQDTYVDIRITEDCAPILPVSIEESPVGGRLVAYYTDENRYYYFRSIDFDAGTSTSLTSPPTRGGWGASVSPDGEWIAFETWMAGGSSERRLVVLNKDLETELSETGYLDEWGPLFGWVSENVLLFNYFEDHEAILYYPFSDQQETIYFDFPDIHPVEIWSRTIKVTLSPILDQLVYPISSEQGVGITLLSLDSDLPSRSVFDVINFTRPTWSPDGNHIVFATFANELKRVVTQANLAVLSKDGQVNHYQIESYSIGLSTNFSWSPRGDQVSFWGFDDDGFATLFLFDIHGPRLVNTCLTTLVTIDGLNSPKWSLDGRYIAFRFYDEDTVDWGDSDLAIYDVLNNAVYRFDESLGPVGWLAGH